MKRDGRKIVGVVVYDYQMAQIVDRAGVDIVSVGDSVGKNVWGQESELEVTLDQMLLACKAVRRGVEARARQLRPAVRAGAGRGLTRRSARRRCS